METLEDRMSDLILNVNVTLTNKVLYFSCIIGRLNPESLPFYWPPYSDWLVFPIEEPDIPGRFVAAIQSKYPGLEDITPSHPDYDTYTEMIEDRVLELMIDQEYPSKRWFG